MKISNFWKTNFLSITFPFIDDFALNIHEINDFLKFWPLMAFFGIHWPFWSFWPWMNFLSKDQSLVIKIKQNWAVSNNQMSKPNFESKLPIYSTVFIAPVDLLLVLNCGVNVIIYAIFDKKFRKIISSRFKNDNETTILTTKSNNQETSMAMLTKSETRTHWNF